MFKLWCSFGARRNYSTAPLPTQQIAAVIWDRLQKCAQGCQMSCAWIIFQAQRNPARWCFHTRISVIGILIKTEGAPGRRRGAPWRWRCAVSAGHPAPSAAAPGPCAAVAAVSLEVPGGGTPRSFRCCSASCLSALHQPNTFSA